MPVFKHYNLRVLALCLALVACNGLKQKSSHRSHGETGLPSSATATTSPDGSTTITTTGAQVKVPVNAFGNQLATFTIEPPRQVPSLPEGAVMLGGGTQISAADAQTPTTPLSRAEAPIAVTLTLTSAQLTAVGGSAGDQASLASLLSKLHVLVITGSGQTIDIPSALLVLAPGTGAANSAVGSTDGATVSFSTVYTQATYILIVIQDGKAPAGATDYNSAVTAGVTAVDPNAASDLHVALQATASAAAVTQAAAGTVYLSWTAAKVGGAPYTVRLYTQAGCAGPSTDLPPITSLSMPVTVDEGTTYSFRVISTNAAGLPLLSACTSSALAVSPASPPALAGFTVATGTVADGDVVVTYSLAAQGDLSRLDIRRRAGAAPSADCQSDGTVAKSLVPPLTSGSFIDATGSQTGQLYYYRACLYRASGDLVAGDAVSAKARDTTPPPALTAFTATTGTVTDGDIVVTWTYPAATADYARLVLRRLAGATAPNADCQSDGSIVSGTPLTTFSQTSLTDATGSTTGAAFSYRACLYDASGNLTAASANAAGNVRARDTVAPASLATFSAVTGASQRLVAITLVYPADVSQYGTVQIRRKAGSTAPASACTNADGSTVISAALTPVANGTDPVADDTGSTTGGYFSYRACIYNQYGTDGIVNNNSTAANVQAKDAVAPPTLSAFSAATGTGSGKVAVTVTFPADTSDIDHVDIRRLAGTSAPAAACTSGDGSANAKTYTTPSFTSGAFDDATGSAGSAFSYRACIYDSSGNLTASQTQTNVTAGSGGGLTSHLIFVSSATAGVGSGGGFFDTACANAAAASINTSTEPGVWKAIYSTSTVDAKDRIYIGGVVKNLMGQTVAADSTEFWSSGHQHAVTYDEFLVNGGSSPWTGTDANGVAVSGELCSDWTSGSGTAEVGASGQASTWIDAGTDSCASPSHTIYCINQ